MNTNQTSDKNVVIIGFTICGIGGFQTITAQGHNANKRIYSAINHMDRELKNFDARESGITGGDPTTATAAAKFAFGVINKVRDQISVQEDFGHIQFATEPLAVLTTEEFFERSAEVYANNVSLFILQAKEIDDALSRYISDRTKVAAVSVKKTDASAKLYLCSGAFFGHAMFPVVMSDVTMEELGFQDPVEAVRFQCTRALKATKSYRMTDYLRAEREEKRAEIRQGIERLDTYIDAVPLVTVQLVGTLVDIVQSNSKLAATRQDTRKKTARILEIETEHRLLTFVASMSLLQNKLGDTLQIGRAHV